MNDMAKSPKLMALLKLIDDLGENAYWPQIVNKANNYGLKFIELRPLLEYALKKGYVREEGEIYVINVKIKRY
ncbi:hypothetical protein [Palaeococcus sp. (in: euryarchaeotes)]